MHTRGSSSLLAVTSTRNVKSSTQKCDHKFSTTHYSCYGLSHRRMCRCNCVRHAKLSAGHNRICNFVRRTVLHMQLCPPGQCCIMIHVNILWEKRISNQAHFVAQDSISCLRASIIDWVCKQYIPPEPGFCPWIRVSHTCTRASDGFA